MRFAKAGKQFPRELAAAVNKVAKKTRSNIGRDIRKTVNLKKEPSERPIKLRRTATAQQPTGIVGIDREQRLGLQHFGARHDKRGVSYKIAKQGGRKRVDGAFMVRGRECWLPNSMAVRSSELAKVDFRL